MRRSIGTNFVESFLARIDCIDSKLGVANVHVATESHYVFDNVPILPSFREVEFSIELLSNTLSVYQSLYRMSLTELFEMKVNWIIFLSGILQEELLPLAAPNFFVIKKDRSLRLYNDYRELNKHTIRNMYPFPWLDDIFDHLCGVR